MSHPGALTAGSLLALVAGGVLGQARHPCLGTVVDDQGRALAGAAVTMLWSPGDGAPGEADVVQVVADGRGRFKADLVVGRAYSAWAIGPAADDGACLVSEVTDRAAAGRVLELAAWHRRQTRRVRCTGFEPWTGGAPPALRLLPDIRHGFALPLPPLQDGTVELPPSAWTTAGIGLLDGKGLLAQVQPLPPDGDAVAFVGTHEVAVQVVDDKGQPIAGTVIEHDVVRYQNRNEGDGMFVHAGDRCWHVAAVTAADGTASVPIPEVPTQTGILGWLRATTPDGLLVHTPVLTAEVAKAREVPDGPLRMGVSRLEPARGAVSGIRAVEIPFAALSTASEYSLPGATYSLQFQLPMSIDAHGILGISTTPADTRQSGLVLHLLPRVKGTPRYAFLASETRRPSQLPSLDLSTLRSCRISAVDADNNPLPGTELALFPTTDRDSHFSGVKSLVFDAAGRAEVLLDESEWAVYATDGRAHALEFVDAGTAGAELRLRLAPMPALRLRVVDAQGKPVRGAQAQGVDGGGFSGVLRDSRGHAREGIAARIAGRAATVARSDRGGLLVLPVQDWRPMRFSVRVCAGSLQSEPLPLAAGDEQQTVVVR